MIHLKTFFLVQANEWLQVSCQFARSPKLREDLRYCSLRKENINFWEEDLTSENQECATVTEDIFGTRTREIVESVTTMSLKSLLNDVDVKVVRYY